jgi:hypothetical protein
MIAGKVYFDITKAKHFIDNILFKITDGGKLWAKNFELEEGIIKNFVVKNKIKFSNDATSVLSQTHFCEFNAADICLRESNLLLDGSKAHIMLENSANNNFYTNASLTFDKNSR